MDAAIEASQLNISYIKKPIVEMTLGELDTLLKKLCEEKFNYLSTTNHTREEKVGFKGLEDLIEKVDYMISVKSQPSKEN